MPLLLFFCSHQVENCKLPFCVMLMSSVCVFWWQFPCHSQAYKYRNSISVDTPSRTSVSNWRKEDLSLCLSVPPISFRTLFFMNEIRLQEFSRILGLGFGLIAGRQQQHVVLPKTRRGSKKKGYTWPSITNVEFQRLLKWQRAGGQKCSYAHSSKSILKFPPLMYLSDGFSSFRQAFPEWCEDDNQAHNKEMESSRNVQTDQLMGLR